jgi:Uncharacterized protein conserved in bacteria
MKIKIDCFNNKKEVQELFIKFIEPLKEYYSREKAELNIGDTSAGYEQKVVPMEGFARQLWGLVPFWMGGGVSEEFEEIYLKGLASGTNPTSEEYWGGFKNRDQRFVEMAAIAYGLLMIPNKLWEPLTQEEKNNLAKWLFEINNYELPDSNWNFFGVLVNLTLKQLGQKYSREKLEYGLSRIEEFYLGNGWYRDGHSNNKDYYISFAIHFYSLIYAKVMEKEDPTRSKLFKERAGEFAHEFIYWFEENGAALPFGRSLTYRFAQVSFWGACIFAGVYPFSIGVMKGLIVRNLVYWFNSSILDRRGILTIGYKYPNIHMSEGYNAPGSPYWSLKTFIILALPDEHEFWKVKEEPLPKLESIKTLEYADMVIQRRLNDVVAYVPGRYAGRLQVHDPSKYSKFAYSTKFGFSVSRTNNSIQEAAPDSMLSFEIDGYIFNRRSCEEFKIENNKIYSRWSPFKGIIVETMLIPKEDGHIRRHKVICDYECIAYDSGFSVAFTEDGMYKENLNERDAYVSNSFSNCKVVSLDGNGKGQIISAEPNTNLIYSKTRIPSVKYVLHKGENIIETEVITQVTQ